MSGKVSFLFCSAPDGAFRVQTAAAARACVKKMKPWVPIAPFWKLLHIELVLFGMCPFRM